MRIQIQLTRSAVTFMSALIIFQTLTPIAQSADEKRKPISLPEVTVQNGGRNGPNTSGDSISEKKDAGITQEEILKGTYECSLRFVKSIYQNALKENTWLNSAVEPALTSAQDSTSFCKLSESTRAGTANFGSDLRVRERESLCSFVREIAPIYPAAGQIGNRESMYAGFSHVWGSLQSSIGDIDKYGFYTTISGSAIENFGVQLNFYLTTPRGSPVELEDRFVLKSIPYVSFKKSISNPVYDEYGRFKSAEIVISNWQLQVPPLSTHAPIYRLGVFGGSGILEVPTSITANTQAYANCLAKVINP